MTVAASTANTMGVSNWMWCLPMTSSTRYFVEAGRIKPDTRFTAINSSPAAKIPRRGLISAHTCGRFFHAFLVFLSLGVPRASFSVGISGGRSEPLVFRCPGIGACYMAMRYAALVGPGSGTRGRNTHGAVEVQNRRNKFANGNAQVTPEAAFEAGVILTAAEEVADQLPKNRAAPHQLHHTRSDGRAQNRATIETPDDARSKFQFRGKRGANPGGIFFGASFGEGFAQQFSGTDGVKKPFAGKWIDPSGGIANEGPVFP